MTLKRTIQNEFLFVLFYYNCTKRTYALTTTIEFELPDRIQNSTCKKKVKNYALYLPYLE